MVTRSLVLALDIGTSSARTALYDERARRIPDSLAQRSYAPATDHGGKFEINPKVLLRAVQQCIDATLEWHQHNRSESVISKVATSCFWHSMVGTNGSGVPLTPIYTWADTRAADDAQTLRGKIDVSDYHSRTGCMLHVSFWPAKQRWLQRTEPALYRSVRYWMSPGEWLLWKLTNRRQCAHGMATGTGLYAPSELDWDEASIALTSLDMEQLSPLADSAFAGSTRTSKRWPALRGAEWLPAIGDGITSNLGCGATRSPYAAINYGTSAALRIVVRGKNASAPTGLFAYRIDHNRFLQGGAISNAGNLHAWARATLRLPSDDAALERALHRRAHKPHGLTVLPFLNGERAPYWRDDLTGCIRGIRQSTTALDIAAALREASFHRLALIADYLPAVRRRTAIVAGGLSKTALQTLADVTGLKVCGSMEREASLRGAAVFALEHGGATQIGTPRLTKIVKPDRIRAKQFAELRAEQVALEQQLFQ